VYTSLQVARNMQAVSEAYEVLSKGQASARHEGFGRRHTTRYAQPANAGSTDWAHVRHRYAYQRPGQQNWYTVWTEGLRREQARAAQTRGQVLLMLAAFAGLLVVDQVSTGMWAAQNRGVRVTARLMPH
jgi:hypothetical protein